MGLGTLEKIAIGTFITFVSWGAITCAVGIVAFEYRCQGIKHRLKSVEYSRAGDLEKAREYGCYLKNTDLKGSGGTGVSKI